MFKMLQILLCLTEHTFISQDNGFLSFSPDGVRIVIVLLIYKKVLFEMRASYTEFVIESINLPIAF
jgi:hypothetical protein